MFKIEIQTDRKDIKCPIFGSNSSSYDTLVIKTLKIFAFSCLFAFRLVKQYFQHNFTFNFPN